MVEMTGFRLCLRQRPTPPLQARSGETLKTCHWHVFCPLGRVSTSSVRIPRWTCNNKKAGPLLDLRVYHGGDDGIRTRDPYVANVMLYQLSYIPMDAIMLK